MGTEPPTASMDSLVEKLIELEEYESESEDVAEGALFLALVCIEHLQVYH